MPVTKYHRVEDMPRPSRVPPDQLAKAIDAVWRRAELFAPHPVVPGVQRFRTLAEANAAREQTTVERMRDLRERRLEARKMPSCCRT